MTRCFDQLGVSNSNGKNWVGLDFFYSLSSVEFFGLTKNSGWFHEFLVESIQPT